MMRRDIHVNILLLKICSVCVSYLAITIITL